MPSSVQTTTEISTETMGDMPQYWVALKDMNAPTMMTSPWAKLSIFAMPYTIE